MDNNSRGTVTLNLKDYNHLRDSTIKYQTLIKWDWVVFYNEWNMWYDHALKRDEFIDKIMIAHNTLVQWLNTKIDILEWAKTKDNKKPHFWS